MNQYRKVYNWYSRTGKLILEVTLANLLNDNDTDQRQTNIIGLWLNLEFIKHLPKPSSINNKLLDYIITQIIYGKLEWAFHKKDINDIKMSDYAKSMAYARYPDGGWRAIKKESFEDTALYKKFGAHHETLYQYIQDLNEKIKSKV